MSDASSHSCLLDAARQAIKVCLNAAAPDTAVVVFDSSTRSIAQALRIACDEVDVPLVEIDFDSFGSRPLVHPPHQLTDALARCSVSAMAVRAVQGEFTLRRVVLEGVARSARRHAHMPSITPDLFAHGLAMDYRLVAAFVAKVAQRMECARHATLKSAAGTNLRIELPTPPAPESFDGLIQPGTWQNLPSGQVTVQPVDVQGVFIVDRSLGDWFQHKYDVSTSPVKIELEAGRVRSVACDNPRLERDLRLFLTSSTDSARVSELAVGANRFLGGAHSGSLFEAYREGASLSVGTVVGTTQWISSTSIQLIGSDLTLQLDGKPLLIDGRFVDTLD